MSRLYDSWLKMHVIEIQIVFIVFTEYVVVLLRSLIVKLALQRINPFLFGLFGLQVTIFELLLTDEMVLVDFVPSLLKVLSQFLRVERTVEVHPQFDENLIEVVVLLLHLLVMAAALFSLPTFHEISHALEYFIGPAQVFENEVSIVDLEEEVVEFAFLLGPVSLLDVLGLLVYRLVFGCGRALGTFVTMLFFAELDVALLAEKGLKVVARNHLFLLVVGRVGIAERRIGIGKRGGLVDERLVRNCSAVCLGRQSRKLFAVLGSLLRWSF